jgi:ribosomal protein S18 acetylase RimI-like enzyme
MELRRAVASDLDRIVALHANRISEGFLPTLGRPFLRRLYRRVLRSRDAFIVVAVPGPGFPVAGFVAGVSDLSVLYRRFVVHDGVIAGLRAAPRLARSAPRVLETLRYPATADDAPAGPPLPEAEILAVAVDDVVAGRGVGGALMAAAAPCFEAMGVHAAKVVTTLDNASALRMYRAAGYAPRARISVHEGTESEVLVWNSSSG